MKCPCFVFLQHLTIITSVYNRAILTDKGWQLWARHATVLKSALNLEKEKQKPHSYQGFSL